MRPASSLDLAVIGGFSAVLLVIVVAELLPGEDALSAGRSELFYAILVSANVINIALLALVGSGQMTDLRRLSGPLVLLYTLLIGLLIQQSGGNVLGFQLLFVVPILIAAVYHDWGGAISAGIMVCFIWSSAMMLAEQSALTHVDLLVGNAGWLVVAFVVGYLLRAEHQEHVHDRETLEATQDRATALRSLIEAGISLTSTLDLQEVLLRIVKLATRAAKAEAASLLLVNEATGALELRVALGEEAAELAGVALEPGEGIVGWVVERGEPAVVPDVREDDRFFAGIDEQAGSETRSLLCVPLKRAGRTLGALELVNKRNQQHFDRSDVELCLAFASQAAVAIENARLVAEGED